MEVKISSLVVLFDCEHLTSRYFHFSLHQNKYLLQTLKQIMKLTCFAMHTNSLGLVRDWSIFRTVPMLSNMFSHPKGEFYCTTSYTARRLREVVACYGKQEKDLSLTSGDCRWLIWKITLEQRLHCWLV